ncbi:MAG: O-antigen ligase family protein [Gaiellaceae bacterium]
MDQAPEPSVRALGTGVLLLVALVGGALAVAVFAGDASGTRGILPVGGLAVALLTASLVAVGLGRLPAPRPGHAGTALVASLLALVAWTGVTLTWSIAADRSWDALNKGLAYAAFLGLGLVLAAAAGRLAARAGAALLSIVIGAALTWAILTKAVPSLDEDGGRIARLSEPVEYWNALALLADVALALGLWLGAAAPRTRVRVAGALLVYLASLSIALTLSRVGLVAGVAVVIFAVALAERRAESALLFGVSALPAVLVSAWAFTRPALVDDGLDVASRESDGALLGLFVVIGAVVVTGGVVLLSRRALGERARERVERVLVVLAILSGIAGAAVVGVAIVSAATSEESCAEVTNDPGRLGSADLNSRLCWWGEAWDVFVQNAPGGAGAGTFEVARKRHRADARNVTQPHSVPLQHLAGGGLVALGLWWLLVGAAVATSACALRRLSGAERSAAVALAAAPLAYGIHSLVDFDWDFLAVTAPTVTALGVLAASGRAPVEARRRPLLAVGAVLVAIVVLFSLTSPQIADRAVRGSTDALVRGDLARAEDDALRARTWNPLSIASLVALAQVEEARGDREAAERRYIEAVELQPENPEAWYALGLFELEAMRRPCAAYRFLNEAYTLDPAGRQWTPGGPLDQARDAVDAGACG